jgi:hypothetical protein
VVGKVVTPDTKFPRCVVRADWEVVTEAFGVMIAFENGTIAKKN